MLWRSNYSTSPLHASQITGVTITEAESNPLPGTFWTYYPIGVTSLTGGSFGDLVKVYKRTNYTVYRRMYSLVKQWFAWMVCS